jgi:hypothetical protein
VAILVVAIAAAVVIAISAAVRRWALPLGVAAAAALWTIGYLNFGRTTNETGLLGIAVLTDVTIWAPIALATAVGVAIGKRLKARDHPPAQ